MHLHTLGASPCGKVSPSEIAAMYHNAGYKAITVTNHYMKLLFTHMYPCVTEREKIKYFIGFYKSVKNYCKQYGIKVFLGMELNPESMNTPDVVPAAEFLCYGVTEEFLYKNLKLYDLTQKELFNLFEKNNILMLQSHPFRGYCVLGDYRYMHGVEVYNGHPVHDSNNQKSEEFANIHNLIGIAGSDFHEKNGITSGIYIPEGIENSTQLVDYLKNNALTLIKENK